MISFLYNSNSDLKFAWLGFTDKISLENVMVKLCFQTEKGQKVKKSNNISMILENVGRS